MTKRKSIAEHHPLITDGIQARTKALSYTCNSTLTGWNSKRSCSFRSFPLAKKNRYTKNNPFDWLLIKKISQKLAWYFLIFSVGSCLVLRWFPPPTTAFMLYRHVTDIFERQTFQAIRYQWVDARHISPNAYAAVIAAEDQHFFQHFGFDLSSIQSSIDDYLDGGRLRGASTISQQVAKNLFLTPSKNFIRKGLEVWFTLLIELLWSKERILTVYLNIAEFGDHVYGIEAASRHYFGVPAQKINGYQAALLAATLPNPMRLKAGRPSDYVHRRQRWILRQMQNLGYQRFAGRK